MLAQDLGNDVGKVLRIRDDGGIPTDNPFVSRAGAKPKIYTYAHRNVYGFAWPYTGPMVVRDWPDGRRRAQYPRTR
jgi:glucose/arabinose dehydrogenase